MAINAVIIIIKSIFYAWWGEEYACICINYWCNLANLSLSIHDSHDGKSTAAYHTRVRTLNDFYLISSQRVVCVFVTYMKEISRKLILHKFNWKNGWRWHLNVCMCMYVCIEGKMKWIIDVYISKMYVSTMIVGTGFDVYLASLLNIIFNCSLLLNELRRYRGRDAVEWERGKVLAGELNFSLLHSSSFFITMEKQLIFC